MRDKLTELKVQIDQTQLVVDREQQRNDDRQTAHGVSRFEHVELQV